MSEAGPAKAQPLRAAPLLALLVAIVSGILLLLGFEIAAAAGGAMAFGVALFDALSRGTPEQAAPPGKVVRTPIGAARRGYVELRGAAQPLETAIKCPVCGVSCLWHGPGRAPGGPRELGSVSNFLITDESGTCAVSPRLDIAGGRAHRHVIAGDIVTVRGFYEPFDEPRSVAVWADPGALKGEASQRVREWIQTPEKRSVLDANRDGRLENREMRAAAMAAEAQVRREVAGRRIQLAGKISVPGLEDRRPFTMSVQRS